MYDVRVTTVKLLLRTSTTYKFKRGSCITYICEINKIFVFKQMIYYNLSSLGGMDGLLFYTKKLYG